MLGVFGRVKGYLLGGFLESLIEVLNSYDEKNSRY